MFTVLGGAGYVGSRLVEHLRSQGVGYQTPGRDLAGVFDRPLGHVVYCIGLTADYKDRPFDTVAAHVCVLNELMRRARFDSLLYLSSTRLYDWRPPALAGEPCREEDDLLLNPGNSRHIYDLSKATGESLCLQAGGPTVRAVRLSCVYGHDLGQDNFLHGVIRQATGRRHLKVASSPDAARDYVHVDDVVAMLVAIARGGRERLYNLAGGVNVDNATLLAAVGAATGCRISATGKPGGGGSSPPVSIERLRDEFNFAPRSVIAAIPALIAAAGEPYAHASAQ